MDENAIRLCEVAGDVFPSAPVICIICGIYAYIFPYINTLRHSLILLNNLYLAVSLYYTVPSPQ